MTNNLETLKALALAATPGEWEQKTILGGDLEVIAPCGFVIAGFDPREAAEDRDNAAFIAAANPKTVLALIEIVEEMEKEILFFISEYEDKLRFLDWAEDAVQNHPAIKDARQALARFEAFNSTAFRSGSADM